MKQLSVLLVSISFTILFGTAVFAEESGTGFVRGRAVLASGKPMQHAVVLFYVRQNGPPPLPERYWRVPESVFPVGTDGTFTAELQEGEYYVGAIGRESSQLVPGPPGEGDLLALARNKSGKPVVVTVAAGKPVENVVLKGYPYRSSGSKKNDKTTTIEGTVLLKDGAPASGIFVFAFLSPERGSKPVFASGKTDKSGKYRLRVDGDGTFYVKARETYGGGKPQNGQLVGVYGDDEPASVTVKAGNRVTGINVRVVPIQRQETD